MEGIQAAKNYSSPLLRVTDLKKHFTVDGGALLKAVDGVSFEINPAETFGVVGESGCGKSTLGKTVLGLLSPTAGEIEFDALNLGTLSKDQARQLRRSMQIIFQDPYSSLNPRRSIRSLISEPLDIHGIGTLQERRERVAELLKRVGLDPDYMNRYPHEFSGGQRQRIGIARALALNPKFIIADEPVSALDVSVQAQVVNLLQDLQEEFGLTYMFISHGLSVVRHISDRVAVMYLGKIVEAGDVDEIYSEPKHPYTKALLSSIPRPVPGVAKERSSLHGDVPTPINPPSGCVFRTRCPIAGVECAGEAPVLKAVSDRHSVACFKA
jgi:oligopeptide/dipeptide ABC transporter ATP-binding protein